MVYPPALFGAVGLPVRAPRNRIPSAAIRVMRSTPSLLPGLLTLVGIMACAGPEPRPEPAPQEPAPQKPAPPEPGSNEDDWVRLNSGEWLRGEILSLDDDEIEFDSDELDTLEIDWSDIAEVLTQREFSVRLNDRRQLSGVLTVTGPKVAVEGPSGATEVSRDDVFRIVPGSPREANYWSGELGLSVAARSGNTDQTDVAYSLELTRETAASRLPITATISYSEVDSKDTENTKRFETQYDRFLNSRLYVTPLGVELMQDKFQNIDRRITPFASLGYTVVDRKKWSVDVTGGFGYRFTRFDSVADGEDKNDSNASIVLGGALESDLTSRVEFDVDYSTYVSVEDTSDTIQKLDLVLSVDVWRDLDLDVSLTWDHIGQPEEDSDGDTPDQDDYKLLIGVVWTF
jgi:putative salt-induced outer membrane protein YdiY